MDLEEGDFKNYEILVHAVKSTSKMIGATHLSEAAFVLEKAAKDEDGETIRQGHESAMKEYRHIADGILTTFGKKTDAKSEENEEILEFFPEGGPDDEILEFFPEEEPSDEVLEFFPEGEADDDVLEFAPEEEPDDYDDDIVEFYPEGSEHP